MNSILEEIFLSSTSLPLRLNREEYLKINYISNEKWRRTNIHRPRKGSLAEFVDTKAVRSRNTLCKPQSPLGIGQWRKRANGTWKIFIRCKYKPISPRLNYLLGSDKILSGNKLFREEKENNNPRFSYWVCFICTNCSCKKRRERRKAQRKEGGREERRGKRNDNSSFFVQRAV